MKKAEYGRGPGDDDEEVTEPDEAPIVLDGDDDDGADEADSVL